MKKGDEIMYRAYVELANGTSVTGREVTDLYSANELARQAAEVAWRNGQDVLMYGAIPAFK